MSENTPSNWLGDEDVEANFDRIGQPRDGASIGPATLVKAARDGGYDGPYRVGTRAQDTLNGAGVQLPVVDQKPHPDGANGCGDGRAERAPILTTADLWGIPDPGYLIDGLLFSEALVQLFAQKKSFKTFIALNMARCLAEGENFAAAPGAEGFAIDEPVDVLFCYGERPAGAKLRVAALQKSLGRDPRAEIPRLRFRAKVPKLVDIGEFGAFWKQLEAAQRDGFRPRCIYFDTYSRAMAGFKQSSDEDVGLFCERAREIISHFGTTIVLLHHTGHENADRGRGSSVLPGDVDQTLSIVADKMQRIAELRMDDMRDGDDAGTEPIAFRGEVVEVGRDPKDRPITSLAFKREKGATARPTGKLAKEALKTLRLNHVGKVLKEHNAPMGSSDLAHAVLVLEIPDLDPADFTREKGKLRTWLQRRAQSKSKDDAPFQFFVASGEGESLTWCHPEARPEPPKVGTYPEKGGDDDH